MNDALKKRCEQFVGNYLIMRKSFKWETVLLLPLVSMLYVNEGKNIDPGYINYCKAIIKKNAGLFSSFRSRTFIVAAAMLSLADNPEIFFENVQNAYKELKDKRFYGSDYLALSALFMARECDPSRYGEIASKARDLYDEMKRNHPFLTFSSDYTYAVMLAMSGLDTSKVMAEAENCYYRLKIRFRSSDAVQSLSHILAIGEEPAGDKCSRVISLYDELKSRKNRFSVRYGLSALGVISLITGDIVKAADDIIEVSEYLKGQKGFGVFSISKDQRLMLAAGLVSDDYVDAMRKSLMSLTLMNSITSIIIAQQTAVICAATSACAASAASN